MKVRELVLPVIATFLVCGCAVSPHWEIPSGEKAYAVIPPDRNPADQPGYIIAPQDKLSITVFREPDLSVKDATVEAGGGLVLPLVGRVQAAGNTTSALADDIRARLKGRYLVDPRVSIIVDESKSQNVTVDGAVQEAGVYQLQGNTTLLQGIAMAKGATRTAKLREVAVFRRINGKRFGALFDVSAIQAGQSADPYLENGDYILVGTSGGKSAFYTALGVLPAFGLFIPLLNR